MPMKRIQIQLEEKDYQIIRKISFVENKPIAEIIREATKSYLNSKKDLNEKIQKTFVSENQETNFSEYEKLTP